MSDLEYDVADGIGVIRLNRPSRRNAFTLEMVEAWTEALNSARTDSAVGVVVLTGADGAFCSGTDLGSFDLEPTPLERKNRLTEHVHRVLCAAEDLDKPLIAAVNGVAVGAGMDMALMCDIRVAARSASFSEGYIRVGIVPGDGGCYFLPRIVGTARALELMWTGDFVDSEHALQLGLVNHVFEDDDFEQSWRSYARRIASGPPLNVRLIKRATYQSSRTDLRTSLDLISSHLAVVSSTADSREALAAFREKRPPAFRGV
jgi:enoyl-CoA hydratase/carnithine racemase